MAKILQLVYGQRQLTGAKSKKRHGLTETDAQKEAIMSEFDCGWIEIRRTSQYFSCARSFDIFIDGTKSGSVKNGERKSFEVPPGEHRVMAKIDWCKTQVVTINTAAGETISLLTGSEIAGWRLLLTIFYMFMPDRMVYLKELPGNFIGNSLAN